MSFETLDDENPSGALVGDDGDEGNTRGPINSLMSSIGNDGRRGAVVGDGKGDGGALLKPKCFFIVKDEHIPSAYATLASERMAKSQFEALKKILEPTMVKYDEAQFLSHVRENYLVSHEAAVVPSCFGILKNQQGSLVDLNPASLEVRLKEKTLVKVSSSGEVLKFVPRKKDLPLTFGFYPDVSAKEKKFIIIAAASKGCSSRVLQPDEYSITWFTDDVYVETLDDPEKLDDADKLDGDCSKTSPTADKLDGDCSKTSPTSTISNWSEASSSHWDLGLDTETDGRQNTDG